MTINSVSPQSSELNVVELTRCGPVHCPLGATPTLGSDYLRNGLTFGFPSRFSSAADNVAQWLPP